MIDIANATIYLSSGVVAPRRRRRSDGQDRGNPLIAGALGVWHLPTGVNQIKSLYLIVGALNLSLSVCPYGSRSWIGAGAGVATTNTIGSEVTGSAPLVGNRVGGADAPPSNAKHRPPDSPTVDPSRPLCVTDRLWSCQRLLARPRTSSRCNMNSESTARLGGFLEVPKVSAARPPRTGRHPTCR